jgi:hypothetical protein
MASIEDRLHVGARLFHTILTVACCKRRQMRLQHELIERVQRVLAELAGKVDLDLVHFGHCRLRAPISLAKRKVAVADKPFEGDGAVFEDPAFGDLSIAFSECFS